MSSGFHGLSVHFYYDGKGNGMHKRQSMAALLIALAGFAAPAAHAGDDIQFFDKENCAFWNPDHIFFLGRGTKGDFNCTYDACRNDQYESVFISADVALGTVIRVFDSSKGDRSDDWAEITVRKVGTTYRAGSKKGVCVGTLEASFENASVKQVYHHRDNLNGKVSLIQLRPAPEPAAAVPPRLKSQKRGSLSAEQARRLKAR